MLKDVAVVVSVVVDDDDDVDLMVGFAARWW
jgi:hypothetical protein